MAYIQPRALFSSVVIDGGIRDSFSDEHAVIRVDREYAMREQDVLSYLLEAIAGAFMDAGVKKFRDYYKRPLGIEIGDEDVDKVVDLNLEFEAADVLDEDWCEDRIVEHYNFFPRRVKVSGHFYIEGFEVIDSID